MTIAPAVLDDLRLGALVCTSAPRASALPLEHTEMTAHISGPLASVAVTQRFGNPFTTPVELAYLFPLPHEAAVVDYELRIGPRTIRGELRELSDARQVYADARAAGQRAGLLEQRRPNLFSIELANVQPGETISATLRYQERLRYDDGDYCFVFPMGLTPKFHADPAEAAQVDAPVAAPSAAIGPIELTVTLDGGGPVGDPRSASHALVTTRLDERRVSVRLAEPTIPNKDFVLRYAVAGDHVRAAAWTAPSTGGAVALITALPPRLDGEVEPAPREFIFVIDRSGSMSGGPLDQARNALRACLRALGTQDTFNIQAFDDKLEWFARAAQGVTQKSVEQADAWLGKVDARGGTDILSAISDALKLKADAERQRYVVFLTDGAVSADDEALRRIERELGRARVFTFGIGPSVNRALLARMADLGHGTAEFLQLNEDIEEAIIRFQDRVAYPVVQDLTLKWENVTAWDLYPARLPDLYIGQPLELLARIQLLDAASPARLVLSGRRGNEPVTLSVPLPPPTTPDTVVPRAWARARVDALLDAQRTDASQTAATRGEIIGLALQHRLLTPYTAFVAVDTVRASDAPPADAPRIAVAVPLPEGLDMSGFGLQPAAPPPPPQMIPAPMGKPAPVTVSASTTTPGGIGGAVTGAAGAVRDALSEAFYKRAEAPKKTKTTDARRRSAADEPSPMGGEGAMPEEAGDFDGTDKLSAELAREKEVAAPGEGLRGLARAQNVSGSWGTGAHEIELTAAAVLAFVRAGHTLKRGHYRRQLAKAVKWLRAAIATDFALRARATALAALAAADNDAALAAEAQAVLATLPALAAPPAGPLTTLDALRVAALLGQPAPLAPALTRGSDAALVAAWRTALGA